MKNILSSLNESEKRRILEMHYKASGRHYLMEEDTEPPAFPTTGVETDGKFTVDKEIISRYGINTNEGSTNVKVKFNHDTGESQAQVIFSSRYSGVNAKVWTNKFGCKCYKVQSGVETPTLDYDGKTPVVYSTSIQKWIKERCVAFVKRTDPKCNTADYIPPSQPSDTEERLVSLFDAIESTSYNMEKNTANYQENLNKLNAANAELKGLGFADKAAAQKKYDELSNIGMKNRTEEQDVEFDKLHNLLVNTLPGLERSSQAGAPSNAGNIQKVKAYKNEICEFINSGRNKKPGLERVTKAINGLLNDKNVYTTPPTGELSSMTLDQKGALFCAN